MLRHTWWRCSGAGATLIRLAWRNDDAIIHKASCKDDHFAIVN